MKIIGITGGIGSGKSIVSKLLEINGIQIYNTDMAAKKISNISQTVRQKLSGKFGMELYQPNNVLNRLLLASLVFDHPENLAFVNSVVHPAVEEDFLEWKEERRDQSFIGIESALLFETRLHHFTDCNMTVSAPLEIRISRTQKRDHMTREAILNRVKNQMTDLERSALANVTLVNDDRQALLPQVENWIKQLKIQ